MPASCRAGAAFRQHVPAAPWPSAGSRAFARPLVATERRSSRWRRAKRRARGLQARTPSPQAQSVSRLCLAKHRPRPWPTRLESPVRSRVWPSARRAPGRPPVTSPGEARRRNARRDRLPTPRDDRKSIPLFCVAQPTSTEARATPRQPTSCRLPFGRATSMPRAAPPAAWPSATTAQHPAARSR